MLSVPFLVSKQKLDYPFIGYYIIGELCSRTDKTGEQLMIESSTLSLSGTTASNVDALVNFVQSTKDGTLCNVKSIKRDVTIKPKEVVTLLCRANPGPVGKKVSALFQLDDSHEWPDGIEISETLVSIPGGNSCHLSIQAENITDHEIVIKNRTGLGRLELERSVTPYKLKEKELPKQDLKPEIEGQNDSIMKSDDEEHHILTTSTASIDCSKTQEPVESNANTELPNTKTSETSNPSPPDNTKPVIIPNNSPINDIDLGELTPEQKEQALAMLMEEIESFSQDDSDIGCCPELQMEIKLKNKQPV